jgi:hypothetical protein
MRLYHEREIPRGGAIDTRDEQECFTQRGKRTGVWLSTEPAEGDLVYTAVVEVAPLEQYEVSGDGATHRSFVVPGKVVSGLGFEAVR